MTRTKKTLSSTRIETSEGVIFFSITNIYNDGKLWEVRFHREDNRRGVSIGNIDYSYSSQKSYTNAIKRANKIN